MLRAVAMAALTLFVGAAGRPRSGGSQPGRGRPGPGRPVAGPLAGLPLSVGAGAGIALFTARLPGPRPVASALGVTLAARLGVLPILVPVLGGLPAHVALALAVAVSAPRRPQHRLGDPPLAGGCVRARRRRPPGVARGAPVGPPRPSPPTCASCSSDSRPARAGVGRPLPAGRIRRSADARQPRRRRPRPRNHGLTV